MVVLFSGDGRLPRKVVVVVVQSLSHARLVVTPWTVACQAPLPMGFPRQEYWNGLPWPLPRVFPTQGLNPHLLHCRQIHVDVWQKPTQYCYCKAIILPLKTIKKKKNSVLVCLG